MTIDVAAHAERDALSVSSPSSAYASSQGHALADVGWLDAHFEAERPEYESLLRAVGLRRGWHVLDAGCGAGSFLPLMAAAVGPTGHITAIDLAPENIAAVEQRLAHWHLDCPVSLVVGNLLDLPLADASLDAVWCANTSQYLSDEDLVAALVEFRRVVRPGGLVAIKEANVVVWNMSPGDPGRMWRALQATRPINAQIHGMLRTPELQRWLEAAGYTEVWQRTAFGERWAPLRLPERQFHGESLAWLARLTEAAALSDADRAFWRLMQTPENPAHPINHPDFSIFGGQTVVVGRVPVHPGASRSPTAI